MKTSPSDKKLSLIPQSFKRKRNFSMRSYGQFAYQQQSQQHIIKNLQKSLQKDNKNQPQPISQPHAIIPGFQQDKSQNKLWKYFISRINLVKNKVQRQQVNVCQRQLFTMKKQIYKKLELFNKKIIHLQKHIKQRYKQIHTHFQEIKSQKTLLVPQNTKKRNKKASNNIISDNNQKITSLKETIQNIRKQITEYDAQLQHNKLEYAHMQKEWLSFLKNLIKQGYYLKNGVISIFNQIIILNKDIQMQDLPGFMDQISKKCLIQEFQKQKQKHKRTNNSTISYNLDKQFTKTRSISNYISDSKKNIQLLMKNSNLATIYNGTKDMMVDWIKKEGWKNQIVLPRIEKRGVKEYQDDWKQNQRKRISHAYQGQVYIKVRNILFGPKVDITH